jgi:hypothetical protein
MLESFFPQVFGFESGRIQSAENHRCKDRWCRAPPTNNPMNLLLFAARKSNILPSGPEDLSSPSSEQ